MKQHLDYLYLRWYAEAYFDCRLTGLRYAPPFVCYTVKRSVKELCYLTYVMFQLYDKLRTGSTIALGPGGSSVEQYSERNTL